MQERISWSHSDTSILLYDECVTKRCSAALIYNVLEFCLSHKLNYLTAALTEQARVGALQTNLDYSVISDLNK